MKVMSSTEARRAFGEMFDTAPFEPVLVTRRNRPVAVFLSMQNLEYVIWGEEALRAHEEDYLGDEAMRKLLAFSLPVDDAG